MQFFSVIGPLATIAGLVTATVIPDNRANIGRISDPLRYSSRGPNVAKRADAGFYFCTSADYEGLCFRDQSPYGTCGMCFVLIESPSCAAISQEEHYFSAMWNRKCWRQIWNLVTVEDDLKAVPDQFGDTVSSASVNEGSRCTLFR